MSSALGARKEGSFKAVSTAPSFNKTPVGSSTPPLPYPTVADLSNSVAEVPSVRLNGQPVYVLDQTTQPTGKGDEPGVCKGVKSGTVTGEVKPTRGSTTVRAGSKAVIRDGDPCTMNGGNNPGIYVTTPAPSTMPLQLAGKAAAEVRPQTVPEKSFFQQAAESLQNAGRQYKDYVSPSLHDFAEGAMESGGTLAVAGGGTAAVGGAMVVTGIGAVPGAVMAVGGGAVATVGGAVAAVGGVSETVTTGLDAAADYAASGRLPDMVALGTAYAQRMVMNKIEKIAKFIPGRKGAGKTGAGGEKGKAGDGKGPAAGGGGGDGFRVQGSGSGGDCSIKPYKDQKCPTGQQAHHIVPDYALRYGSRKSGVQGLDRIPGMPSFEDGPSICLSGGAKEKGSEHNVAHEGTDPRIASSGSRSDNGLNGLTAVGELIDISVDEIGKVKPHCKEEVKQKVDEAFKGVDRNKYGRTTQTPPKQGSSAHSYLSAGENHASPTDTRRRKGKRR